MTFRKIGGLLSLTVFVLALFAVAPGCGSDGGGDRPDFRISDKELTLASGESVIITVGGGRSPYHISEPDESIATANLSGDTVTVVGMGGGNTTFTISDSDEYSETISVTVTGAPAGGNDTVISVDEDGDSYIDFALIQPATAQDQIIAELPDGAEITLKKEEIVERNADSYTWFGSNQDGELDSVVLTVTEGVLFGRIENGDDAYYLRPDGVGYKMFRHEPEAILPLTSDVAPVFAGRSVPPPYQQPPEEPMALQSEDGAVIDILVLYTERMQTKYGDHIDAKIQHFIDLTNKAFTNSGVQTELNLVHSELYAASGARESQLISDALERIQTSEIVGDLRDNYKADLVCLLREFAGAEEKCGRAFVMNSNSGVNTSFESHAFSVVEVRPVDNQLPIGYCSEFTFAHEIGHNLGCAHDRGHAGVSGAFSYAFGYDEPGVFATIMSYDEPRIAYFSNPDIEYETLPIGVREGLSGAANNALAINNTRQIAANFRINTERSDDIVILPDPSLEALIRTEIEKPSGPIYESDLLSIELLYIFIESIESIEGLQYCLNLRELDLRSNRVSDLGPLSNLTKLETLLLNENPIESIGAIADLPAMKELNLSKTEVEDISPVSNLETLEVLYLWGMGIDDISAVGTLANLVFISFGNNRITDITALEDLTNLETVWLEDNFISNIKPLASNTGIGDGDEIILWNNPLDDDACETYIPFLIDRGVDIKYNNCN